MTWTNKTDLLRTVIPTDLIEDKPQDAPAPGAFLPRSFNKSGYTDAQLTEIEELYVTTAAATARRVLRWIHTPRPPHQAPTVASVALAAACLMRLLHILPPSVTWAAIAHACRTNEKTAVSVASAIRKRMLASAVPTSTHDLLWMAQTLRAYADRAEQLSLVRRVIKKIREKNEAGNR